MREDKPTFKVTDRRLFNPDGTPRDIESEEPAATPAGDDSTPAPGPDENAQPASAAAAPDEAAPRDQREAAHASSTSDTSASAPDGRGGERERGAEEGDGAEDGHGVEDAGGGATGPETEADPTPFANLVMFIASPAAAAMGMTEHPDLQPGEYDLPFARHCIDLLGTMREKSRGSLSMQEQQILESILAELQMQYVSLTSTRRPSSPRGFSGSDITGGR